MRKAIHFSLDQAETFRLKLLEWSKTFDQVCLLDNNGFSSQNRLFEEIPENQFDWLCGVGAHESMVADDSRLAFQSLEAFSNQHEDWILGYLSYDLKNEVEQLTSENKDGLKLPEFHFFIPRYIFLFSSGKVTVEYLEAMDTVDGIHEIIKQIELTQLSEEEPSKKLQLNSRISKKQYIQNVSELKDHIQKGDIYEVNFCQEFYAENAVVAPVELYNKLNDTSPTPFSAYYRNNQYYLLCASPERYLKKIGNKVYSQPIKGTAPRGFNAEEDERIKNQLYLDPKERSENVMIVDLVRNDLSRSAQKDSVQVDELFGVYTFPQVHQLISTVSANINEDTHFVGVLKDTFPMGSMTGAPKVRAMKLIEQFETSKRGLFSGTVGVITPKKDFDFNVVIRSIIFNDTAQYLSFMVGGAITANSIPEKEYDESMLKAKAMFSVLNTNNN